MKVRVCFDDHGVEVQVSSNEAFQKIYLFTNQQVEDTEGETAVNRH